MSKRNRKEKGKHEAFQKYPHGQAKKVEKPKKKSCDKKEKSGVDRG